MPTASGNAAAFIDTISQNANGEITVTKRNVWAASASRAGLMSAADFSKLAALPYTVASEELCEAAADEIAFVPEQE